jgi:hypothetical protein
MDQSVAGALASLKRFAARGLAIVSRLPRGGGEKSPYVVR